jgi:acetyl esterase/lipase
LLPEADGLDIVEDAIDAAVWVSKNVAPRILLAGSSAGGYLALAIAANRRAPPLLATLFIYGMLDLTASRYVRAGTNLGGAPPVETQELLEQVTVAMQSGDVIDGYEFPAQPPTDRRFRWVAALHQDAVIPDVLTRMPGLSQNIRELGAQVIPEQLRDLFPATFRLTKAFPPTALLHGDADILVDYRQSSGLAERLGTLGINVLLEKAVGQGHGFDVKSIPSSIDVHLQRADDPEFYQSLRRVLMFLDSIIAKANTSSIWIQE